LLESCEPVPTGIGRQFMKRASVGPRCLRDSGCSKAGSVLHRARPVAPALFFVALLMFGALPAKAADLANDTIRLDLETTSEGIPTIASATWKASGKQIFADAGLAGDLASWVPDSLLPAQNQTFDPAVWSISSADKFIVAKASLSLPSSLKVTWVIELAKSGSLFRLHVDYENTRKKRMPVQWFPAWSASWTVPANPDQIRWWDALAYTPEQKPANKKANVSLFSHLYSSAARDGGSLPYWVVDGAWGKLYFGLSWSGGWQAQINSKRSILRFSVSLPPEETELVLDPGESVEGPRLVVTPTVHTDNLSGRRSWMFQRSQLGNQLYGGPAPAFPLAYNHWYAVRTDVDPVFLRNQIQAMGPYGFDAFIVDAGWYDSAGDWLPDPSKFQPGELESILRSAKSAGATPGLWSAPQYVLGQNNQAPAGISDPGSFNPLVDGYLLDLWKGDYKTHLLDHIQTLTQRFSIGWWKYDQPIFDADARSNIQVALGALETVFPWAAYRWTNNLDQHQDDDEFTRYYCRSAMAGVWGISSDLSKIGDHQRSVVLNEIQNYRRLNAIKKYDEYDIVQPADGANLASVTYYGKKNQEASAIVYRWSRKDAFTQAIWFKGLDKSISYVITDADTGVQTTMSGQDLSKQGYSQSFSSGQLSALLFVEPATQ